MAAPRNSALAVLDIVIGLALIIVALWMHLIIPGIPFALMVIGGILLGISGVMNR